MKGAAASESCSPPAEISSRGEVSVRVATKFTDYVEKLEHIQKENL